MRLYRWIADQWDRGRAGRYRRQFGREGWLVSWHPHRTGWLARVSLADEDGETFEATGPTRRAAILAAHELAEADWLESLAYRESIDSY